ncbi:MAG: cyclic nucleotide-binding domain-containing protein [Hyphomonadaceae bacterium]|nr:cyclic nucleotide-binding domain-containing protein [Hyphomonadaceae bacterium]
MAIEHVIAPLLRVPLFADLGPEQLAEIARQAERIAFRRGSTITKAGTPGDGACLIVSGDAVRLPDAGSRAAPQPIEPGSLIGELAMLVEHTYGATVVAQGRVHCLKITRAALHEQMEADPSLADHLLGILTARLTQVAEDMHRLDSVLACGRTPRHAAADMPPPAPAKPLPFPVVTAP